VDAASASATPVSRSGCLREVLDLPPTREGASGRGALPRARHRCLRLRYLLPLQHPTQTGDARRLSICCAGLKLARTLTVPIPARFGGAAVASKGALPSDEAADAWWPSPLRLPRPPLSSGVTIALETHDAFASARPHRRRTRAVARRGRRSPGTAITPIAWRVPIRVLALLGPYLAHVHVKDARRVTPESEEWQLLLSAKARCPYGRCFQALAHFATRALSRSSGRKKWHPTWPIQTGAPQHAEWLRQVRLQDGW